MVGKSTPLFDIDLCNKVTETARSLTGFASKEIKTFSYRAECKEDSIEFKKKCRDARILIVINTAVGNKKYPDQDVEFEAAASLEQLRNIARMIPDGYVLLQTLRECALKDNSLIRDDIE